MEFAGFERNVREINRLAMCSLSGKIPLNYFARRGYGEPLRR